MNKKDKQYWEERQEQTFLAGEKRVQEYYKDLEKAFEQAKKEIQSVINDFYARYADENRVSYADAQKSLDNMELGDLKDFIELVNKSLNQYNQKLNNMSIKARITRYQALEKQIDAILQRLYAIEYQYKGEEILKEVYSDSYYRTWFNIDQYHGFHQEFAQINPRTIEELIKYPWSGADFSSRIWRQKDHMLQKLKESITTMIIQGKNPSTLSKDFAKIFKTKEHEAYRLLYTEGSFIIEQGTLAAYREDGVKKYQILATLDMKTSDICRSEDGKIYDVDKAVVGVNYPPYHPFCRTTTVPYYEDEDYSEGTRKARDPVTSKTYEVPADMTYNQWYNKYVANNPEAMFAEKKWKNRYTDKKQYERYKEVLGKDLGVKSLDEFQELKYNNIEEWKLTKYNYKLQNSVLTKDNKPLENYNKLYIADAKYTGYLFNLNNEKGYAKGKAIKSRLGYDINNYKELDKLIKSKIGKYPANSKGNTKYGQKFEINMVLRGLKNKQAKLKIGIMVEKDSNVPKLTTMYIDKLKESD